MKKLVIISTLSLSITAIAILSGCTAQREVAAQKSGAELWAQNCIRCHNIPSPTAYNNDEWETIGLHMRERANMTNEQIGKIVEFLQAAN
ncbi:MAG: cytochrome c [Bacteroidales bacterium]|nr:cytochrome c [Bacteroidales bacterium]MCF6342221.1 cytochrome c [Bacteroidales bacterium]